MNVDLVIQKGRKRKVFTLRSNVSIVGRSHGNTVRIPSADVSRRHCRILVRNGVVEVEDLDSVNGTFLNGVRIKRAEVVRPGDRLEVGPVQFVVEYELTPDALKRLNNDSGDQLELLEGLADGDVMDGELPVLEPLDMHGLEPVDLDAPDEVTDVDPVHSHEDTGPLKADFDFEGTPWRLPDGGDLRDLLTEMEDDTPPPAKGPKPKKR